MTPDATAEIIRQAAAQSPDPMFSGLAWVLGILVLLIAIAKPIMVLVRQYRSDRADDARDKADEAVFARMKQQLDQNSADIRTLIDEKNRWYEKALSLQVRVEQLESAEQTIMRLKQKLDEKDDEIRKRDAENRQLMYEIIQLKDRIHHLEMRLTDDEAKFCASCELKHKEQA